MSLRRKLVLVLLLLLAAFCWIISLGQLTSTSLFPVTQFYQGREYTAKELDDMRQLELDQGKDSYFTGWNQSNSCEITAPLRGQRASVAVISLDGDSRLVIPSSATLHPTDTVGCLIDVDTALQLFGHPNGVGNMIVYEKKEYIVRGILSIPTATMLINAPLLTKFSHLSVQGGRMVGTDFAARHQLFPVLRLFSDFFGTIHRLLAVLPLIVLLVFLMLACLSKGKTLHTQVIPHVFLSAMAWVCGTMLLLIALLLIPSHLLPKQWADFDHWSQTAKESAAFFRSYVTLPKYQSDFFQWHWVGKSAYSLISCVCFVVGWGVLMTGTKKKQRREEASID